MHRAENLATFMCRLSGSRASFNLLEPSGHMQTCTGIALPKYNYTHVYKVLGKVSSASSSAEGSTGF